MPELAHALMVQTGSDWVFSPDWQSSVSFADLVAALNTKHLELNNAYDALLTGFADSEQTIVELPRVFPKFGSVSIDGRKFHHSSGVPVSVESTKEIHSSTEVHQGEVLRQQNDRFDSLLERFEALTDKYFSIPVNARLFDNRISGGGMDQEKSIRKQWSRPKQEKSLADSQPLSRIQTDNTINFTDSFESTDTSETPVGKRSTITQRFGFEWHGERRNARKKSITIEPVDKVGRMKDILDGVSGPIIIAYVVFMGLELEFLSRRMTSYTEDFFVVHMVFNSYFLLELLIRLALTGIKDFFLGREWRLNWIDLGLVISSLMDVLLKQAPGSDSTTTKTPASSRILRSIRVVRIVRMMRVLRAIAEIREFQKMVFAISSSMKTLLCSLVILFFILYFFAVIFAYGAIDAREYDPDIVDLETYWGTFLLSIYSCFISISTGQSWHFVLAPLAEYSLALSAVFLVFIAMTIFGVLNAITSIFVESAIMSAQYHKDLIILDKEHEKEIAFTHMKRVFGLIDEDGSGEISADEMEYFLARDDLSKYLEALQISADDTRMLFRLLDTDDSSVIDLKEFCEGCMRLKGEARAFDIHILIYQVKKFVEKWSMFTDFVEEKFQLFDDRTNALRQEIESVKKAKVSTAYSGSSSNSHKKLSGVTSSRADKSYIARPGNRLPDEATLSVVSNFSAPDSPEPGKQAQLDAYANVGMISSHLDGQVHPIDNDLDFPYEDSNQEQPRLEREKIMV